ncbi:hypothetical protein BP6252_08877 [Coleophoma cylindrospora]|uniref:Uncharacterized protein n=1 Tax=Coleophoma cylindrospora TaxID=1849047 RepID=A0A3D8R771_9HELO|nr:hypothetical protein BP6252_08877 [Coleophoma cylindrospora]
MPIILTLFQVQMSLGHKILLAFCVCSGIFTIAASLASFAEVFISSNNPAVGALWVNREKVRSPSAASHEQMKPLLTSPTLGRPARVDGIAECAFHRIDLSTRVLVEGADDGLAPNVHPEPEERWGDPLLDRERIGRGAGPSCALSLEPSQP